MRPNTAIAVSVLLAAGCQPLLGGSDPLEQAEQAHVELNEALVDYFALDEPADSNWDAFYAEGSARLQDLVDAYDAFADATNNALESGVDNAEKHERYLELLGRWVATQQAQLQASRQCTDAAEPSVCFVDLLADPSLQLPYEQRAEIQRLSLDLYGH